ncbi:MAG: type II toxin-antitoxin system VapC family toxin [Geminicoccaceae bacterium]
MRLLLDSNALFWYVIEPEALSAQAFATIDDPDSEVYFSAVNLWELAIKRAKGKLEFDDSQMLEAIEEQSFLELPVTSRHGLEAAALPPYHADPFDRMLIAQARLEGLTLVTSDRQFSRYRVLLMEA